LSCLFSIDVACVGVGMAICCWWVFFFFFYLFFLKITA